MHSARPPASSRLGLTPGSLAPAWLRRRRDDRQMIVDAADPRPDSTPNSGEPLILDVGRGITLRGRAWGPVDGEPWLVLHGWLDNCASFDFLCPLLLKAAAGRGKPMRLVCLDFAGHGHSSHRHGCSYTTADHVHDTRMAVLRLGWDEFNIIGHSMGGGIAATLAGPYPSRPSSCFLCCW